MLRKFFPVFLSFYLHLAVAEAQKKGSLLWKVEGPGMVAPSFIFGTIHLIPAADFHFSRAADSVFGLAGKVVFEMDVSDPALQLKVLKHMQLDSGKTLRTLFSENDYRKIQRKAEKLGLNLELFQNFLPVMVQQNFILKTALGSDTRSYELFLMDKARQSGKSVVGLETAEDQVKALKAIPLEKQARMLKESVVRPHKARKELLKLINLYKTGNIDKMHKLTTRDKNMKEGREALLARRNNAWVEKLKPLMEEGPVFVAVGAAHLGGPEGLVALLEKEGYRVTALY
jgi:uncharacterized protein YbaP (TraB family)